MDRSIHRPMMMVQGSRVSSGALTGLGVVGFWVLSSRTHDDDG
jgi:hypothetical protein